jgi:hypothetical protein
VPPFASFLIVRERLDAIALGRDDRLCISVVKFVAQMVGVECLGSQHRVEVKAFNQIIHADYLSSLVVDCFPDSIPDDRAFRVHPNLFKGKFES